MTGSVEPGLELYTTYSGTPARPKAAKAWVMAGSRLVQSPFISVTPLAAENFLNRGVGKGIALVDQTGQTPAGREIHQQRPPGAVELGDLRGVVGLPRIRGLRAPGRGARRGRGDIGEVHRQKDGEEHGERGGHERGDAASGGARLGFLIGPSRQRDEDGAGQRGAQSDGRCLLGKHPEQPTRQTP